MEWVNWREEPIVQKIFLYKYLKQSIRSADIFTFCI